MSRHCHARQEPTQALGISVLQEPSVEEITRCRARIDVLRPMQVEELLGRDASGLIGSELCRQIQRLQPKGAGQSGAGVCNG